MKTTTKKIKKMKVKDYLTTTGTKGFMPVMENAFPELYTALFSTIDPMLLDNTILMRYGGRELIDVFSNDTAVYLIKGIIILKQDSWQAQAKALNTEYDLLSPVTGETTTKTSESVDEKNSDTNTKQSTTFNDSNFGDDERNEQTGTGNRTSEKTQSVTNSGYYSGTPVSDIVRKEINLRKVSFKQEVIKDLISELILSIY